MRYRQAFALTLTLALLMGLAGPGQAQKALKIFMIPKFTGAAYFAATEKGAKDAVAELKGRGVAIDFLYTGPSVANTDEEIRMIDDLVAQKLTRSSSPPTMQRRWSRWRRRPRPPASRSSRMTPTSPIPRRGTGLSIRAPSPWWGRRWWTWWPSRRGPVPASRWSARTREPSTRT